MQNTTRGMKIPKSPKTAMYNFSITFPHGEKCYTQYSYEQLKSGKRRTFEEKAKELFFDDEIQLCRCDPYGHERVAGDPYYYRLLFDLRTREICIRLEDNYEGNRCYRNYLAENLSISVELIGFEEEYDEVGLYIRSELREEIFNGFALRQTLMSDDSFRLESKYGYSSCLINSEARRLIATSMCTNPILLNELAYFDFLNEDDDKFVLIFDAE